MSMDQSDFLSNYLCHMRQDHGHFGKLRKLWLIGKYLKSGHFPRSGAFVSFEVTHMSDDQFASRLLARLSQTNMKGHCERIRNLRLIGNSPSIRSFPTFCKFRIFLVTHMSIDQGGSSSSYRQRHAALMCPAISGRYVRSLLKNIIFLYFIKWLTNISIDRAVLVRPSVTFNRSNGNPLLRIHLTSTQMCFYGSCKRDENHQ